MLTEIPWISGYKTGGNGIAKYKTVALPGAPRQVHRENRIARGGHVIVMLCLSTGIAAYLISAVPGAAAPAQQAARAATLTEKPDANLLQLMRGAMFAQSNVIFAGQMDVSTIPHDALPAVSPNPLTSVYGGWQAVENSSLALAESAKLLIVPGRTCANGIDVPVKEVAWVKYTNAMRDAAMEAYKAAQGKSTDDMVEATSAVSESCAACHNVYRSNRASFAARCTATVPVPAQSPAANQPPAQGVAR
jgi:hypothetical protein